MSKLGSLIGFLFWSAFSIAQDAPFDVYLETVSIPGLPGLQSYAFGQHDGKWLIIGGRLDGLHRRQPFATFDINGHHNLLLVVDPESRQTWTAPLSSLAVGMREQLSSTNMQFYQEGEYLYCLGGYGYSGSVGDHTTFPDLTAIHVPEVIDAIIHNRNFTSFIRQIFVPEFQVTGGQLEKVYNTFYLLGGQKFLGRYNPMGPDHGPGFFQKYTDAIQKFSLADDGNTLEIQHHAAYIDSVNLHRRDYNAIPQIMPDRTEGVTMFSGVFQPIVDLPYLNCVNVDTFGYEVNPTFYQYYNHYHCAVMPLYDADANQMHNVFFGGIAQYYDSLGILVQDNNVPFVKTIARVTRDAEGIMREYRLPAEMPALLGAGSEFIPFEHIQKYPNGVLRLDLFTADTTAVGYIYGGISSSEKNIFWINTGAESTASHQVFRVHVIKNNSTGVHDLNEQSNGTLKLEVFPNPNDGTFTVKFNLIRLEETKLSIYTLDGKEIESKTLTGLQPGENTFQRRIKNLNKGGAYILTIETPYESATQVIHIAL